MNFTTVLLFCVIVAINVFCFFLLSTCHAWATWIADLSYVVVYASVVFISINWAFRSSFVVTVGSLHTLVDFETFRRIVKEGSRFLGCRFYHDHEIRGLENLPKDGPFVMTMYHPRDLVALCFVFSAHLREVINSEVRIIAHRLIFNDPFAGAGSKAIGSICESKEECVKLLRDGTSILVFPGGRQEFMNADQNYTIDWPKDRLGFASMATETDTPIIPAFTRNSNETGFYRKFFEKIPLWPSTVGGKLAFGYFPVKLITYFGEPLYPKDYDSLEALAEAAQNAVKDLRDRHQPLPGSVLRGLAEHFYEVRD